VRAYLSKLPDYVCRVEIARYQGAARKPQDHLFLDVAFVAGRELYALPGDSRFERSIARFSHSGALSTGSYAMHVRELFTTDHAEFQSARIVRRNGREEVTIVFVIPRQKSAVSVTENGEQTIVGYEGSVTLSPGTFELQHMDVRIVHTPREIDIARTREVTEYRRVRIGGSEIALPASTEFELQTRSGRRLRNVVKFGDCRKYTAETTIHFDEPPLR
jgi:hypothetical protein